MAIPIELSERDSLVKSASTVLNSKVVCQYSSLLSQLVIDATLALVDPAHPDLLDLRSRGGPGLASSDPSGLLLAPALAETWKFTAAASATTA